MIIGLDFDSVLADTIPRALVVIKAITGQEHTKEEVTSWKFLEDFALQDKVTYEEVFHSTWGPDWMEVTPTEEDLAVTVSRLRQLGTVEIVSATWPDQVAPKKRWLDYHKIYPDSYRWVGPESTKPTKYDIIIDDSPEIARKHSTQGTLVLLRDQPWNRSVVENEYLIRIHSLKEAIGIIKQRTFKRHLHSTENGITIVSRETKTYPEVNK